MVPGDGYRVAFPHEHLAVMESRRRRSYRQLSSGHRTARATNRAFLTPEQAALLDEQTVRISQLESLVRHHGRRIASVEKKQVVQEDALVRLQAALDELRAKGLVT